MEKIIEKKRSDYQYGEADRKSDLRGRVIVVYPDNV